MVLRFLSVVMTVPKSIPDLVPVTAATFCHGFVADQNAAITRALDVTATTPHLLGITPIAEPWRRGYPSGMKQLLLLPFLCLMPAAQAMDPASDAVYVDQHAVDVNQRR